MKKKITVSARVAYAEGTDYQFDTKGICLGPWTSYSYINDPKHMSFVLARYKFCARMLEGKQRVLEVGSGDGFGLPIVCQSVKQVYAVDWDTRLLDSNKKRLAYLKNVSYIHCDLNSSSPKLKVDGAYLIDVIEHLEPHKEARFMKNIVRCLLPDGVIIIGTPNITASAYATPRSRVQHINLKSMAGLRRLAEKYFKNVFMFGMNDEVLHTGYAPMCHYIWAVGAGVRRGAVK
ncbi:MAG: class I SAM-dependent methyltransferase [Candidatus Omnitrophota bacterium]